MSMMKLRRAPTVSWVRLPQVVAGLRAVATQGVRSSYRKQYWSFIRDVVRWEPSRLAEALMLAAAGHHFIEYTRRIVVPRLSEGTRQLAASTLAAPSLHSVVEAE
jgi:hypothetical protein